MERDFMGLGSGKVSPLGKEESGDAVPARGLGMQWSFSNKPSAIPHFLSCKAGQEDQPRRNVYDHPFSSSSAVDALESNQKAHPAVVQKNLSLEKQVGSQFVMTGYPLQHLDALSVLRPYEVGKFLVFNQPNQSISVNPQPLGGVAVVAPAPFPTTCSFIGTTDQRDASKPSGAAAQLTIFYDGSVNVFDGISPEKAQAIMLLAGNEPSASPNIRLSSPQGQRPITMPSGGDGVIRNSTQSHVGSQTGGGSSCTDELMAGKTKGVLTSTNQPEPPKAVTQLVSTSPAYIPAVPQARKASLARFLEKRKERMMNASPYCSSAKSPDSGTPASNAAGLSMNSSDSSSAQP